MLACALRATPSGQGRSKPSQGELVSAVMFPSPAPLVDIGVNLVDRSFEKVGGRPAGQQRRTGDVHCSEAEALVALGGLQYVGSVVQLARLQNCSFIAGCAAFEWNCAITTVAFLPKSSFGGCAWLAVIRVCWKSQAHRPF